MTDENDSIGEGMLGLTTFLVIQFGHSVKNGLNKKHINTIFYGTNALGYLEIWSEIRRKKNKVYVALNPAERRLLMQGLLSFRNKVLARGIDTIDLDRIDIMKQVYNFKASDGDAPWKKKQVSINKKTDHRQSEQIEKSEPATGRTPASPFIAVLPMTSIYEG